MTLLVGGVPVVLLAQSVFQSLEMEVGAGISWKATLELFDPTFDTLESLFQAVGANREFLITFGQAGTAGKLFRGTVLNYTAKLRPGSGTEMSLTLMPGPLVEALLDRRILSFAEGHTASQIVEKIVKARGWDAVIEPTPDIMAQPQISEGETDMRFIDTRLRPQARNTSGIGGYIFYVDESGVLHFHTPEFQPARRVAFRFGNSPDSTVISFEPTDMSIFSLVAGAGDTRYVGVDSAAGDVAVVNKEGPATQVSGTGIADIPDVIGAPGDPVGPVDQSGVLAGASLAGICPILTRDSDELERLTQSRYDEFRRRTLSATLSVLGTHLLRMGDVANVECLMNSGKLHYLSGDYTTMGVKHSIGSGGWTTTFALQRGTAQPSQVVELTEADADPSVGEAQGSGIDAHDIVADVFEGQDDSADFAVPVLEDE